MYNFGELVLWNEVFFSKILTLCILALSISLPTKKRGKGLNLNNFNFILFVPCLVAVSFTGLAINRMLVSLPSLPGFPTASDDLPDALTFIYSYVTPSIVYYIVSFC